MALAAACTKNLVRSPTTADRHNTTRFKKNPVVAIETFNSTRGQQ